MHVPEVWRIFGIYMNMSSRTHNGLGLGGLNVIPG